MRHLLLPLVGLFAAGCAQLPTASPALSTTASVASSATQTFDGAGYPVTVCDARYAGVPARCSLDGEGPAQVLRGNLISGGTLYVGGALRVGADGRIEAAGCQVPQTNAVTLDCPGSLISAGFINLHEHIDYSYQQPAQPPTSKWVHRNEWRKLTALERGFEGEAPKDEGVRTEVSERAMLRHALSGTTALSGAKDYRAFLRNLKVGDGPFAVPAGKPVLDATFPLNDARSYAWPAAPCSTEQVAAIKVNREQPYVPHVGEGTNTGARYEVDCVLDAVRGKTTPSAFIHGVAISPEQITRLKAQNVAVVLSPRSNFQLYGATAPATALKSAGVTLALGTDWSPSGSLTLLDEARCFDRYNRDVLGRAFSGADLHRMMTSDAARAVGLQGQVGALAVGELADLVVIDTEGRTTLADVLTRTALKQTLAVFVGGRAASFPSAWSGRLPQLDGCAPDPRDLCGQQRTVCGANPARPLAQLLKQAVYTIDDTKLCTPQPTEDCRPR